VVTYMECTPRFSTLWLRVFTSLPMVRST